ncbi:CD151 antigen, putative [Pediculus humanus corporis]|uniref:Tetraspanin n=1 Tax=Pediculus humanus subsp. corporis TaxID=121224 RepID=E0VXQ9_PEDHC|nr:CD151 antigen, putative [Pediculus humanus corporis]EEB18165.1 CD151 antigen, putative [Pediculus humanus corporis]
MVKNRRHESECCNVFFLNYVLHIFNIIFVTAGFSVLAVGVWSVIEKHKYVSLLTSVTYPMSSYVLIGAGCLVLVVAVIGCFGVIKENRCLLLIYTFLLLFIFLLEAMVGTLAYIYEEQVEAELKLNLNSTFLDNYKIDADKTKAIDDMQIEFKCCGAVRFEDWRYSKWFHQSRKTSNNLVPDSCCKTPSLNCGVRDHPSNIQYKGCLNQLSKEVKSHLVIISSVGLGICVLQIFGVIFSFCLYIKLKNKEETRP